MVRSENKAHPYPDEDIGKITSYLKHYRQFPSGNLCFALRHVSFNELSSSSCTLSPHYLDEGVPDESLFFIRFGE